MEVGEQDVRAYMQLALAQVTVPSFSALPAPESGLTHVILLYLLFSREPCLGSAYRVSRGPPTTAP